MSTPLLVAFPFRHQSGTRSEQISNLSIYLANKYRLPDPLWRQYDARRPAVWEKNCASSDIPRAGKGPRKTSWPSLSFGQPGPCRRSGNMRAPGAPLQHPPQQVSTGMAAVGRRRNREGMAPIPSWPQRRAGPGLKGPAPAIPNGADLPENAIER